MTELASEALLQLDKQHVWHPYSSFEPPVPPLPVASAQGVELILADGRTLIDAMASWWCAIHGYNHPALNVALQDQASRMSHVMFGGLTHAPAVKLAAALVDITPPPLDKVFLADSGSIAVEVAIKMAVQYWASQGDARKHKIGTVRNGYHGDTFGAMSVCDPVTGMHELFTGMLPQQLFTDAPPLGFDSPLDHSVIANFRHLFEAHHTDMAAFIIEPVVQGAGGMRIYNPAYLKELRRLCDEFDVLLIFDEIATGFGRTGKLLACEHAQVVPDIMTLGKAITGGYLTLAATLCSTKISDGISHGEAAVLMHGPTFMANPLACSVALASLSLLLSSPWKERVAGIEQQLTQELLPLREHAAVADVRSIGAIGVVEMHEPVDIARLQPVFVDQGVWLRPFGKLIYCMPPYIISPEQLSRVTGAVAASVAQCPAV